MESVLLNILIVNFDVELGQGHSKCLWKLGFDVRLSLCSCSTVHNSWQAVHTVQIESLSPHRAYALLLALSGSLSPHLAYALLLALSG